MAVGYNSDIHMPSGGVTVNEGRKCIFPLFTVFPAAVFTAHYPFFLINQYLGEYSVGRTSEKYFGHRHASNFKKDHVCFFARAVAYPDVCAARSICASLWVGIQRGRKLKLAVLVLSGGGRT